MASDKTYSIHGMGTLGGMLRIARRVLPDALAPFTPTNSDIHGSVIEAGKEFGWVTGAFDSPFRNDHYIVEFVSQNEVRILAYLDQFGRAFATDEPVEAPPAREPELDMRKFADASTVLMEEGCLTVRFPNGDHRRVATYYKREGSYTLVDSWYDFGIHAQQLTYVDLMTRVYLACVYRPTLTGIPVPTIGLGSISELLSVTNPTRGIRAAKMLVERALSDPALKPPALARLLVKWLEEAGFTNRASHSWLLSVDHDDETGPLRLIRTRRYANTYFLAANEALSIPPSTIWAVESALNRFLLLQETLGEAAATASEAECLNWDDRIRATIALQAPTAEYPADGEPVDSTDAGAVPEASGFAPDEAGGETPRDDGFSGETPVDDVSTVGSENSASSNLPPLAGEWDVRLAIGQAMERLRLPYRYRGLFHVDVTEPGVAAFLLTVPDASLMPRRFYDRTKDQWVPATDGRRHDEAFTYAIHLGIALAAAAFAASRAIQQVTVTTQPLNDDSSYRHSDHVALVDAEEKWPWIIAERLKEQQARDASASTDQDADAAVRIDVPAEPESNGHSEVITPRSLSAEPKAPAEEPPEESQPLPGVLGQQDGAMVIPWARGVVRLVSPQDAVTAKEAEEARLAAKPNRPTGAVQPATPEAAKKAGQVVPYYYQVTFEREAFCYKEAYRLAAATEDPLPFLEFFDAKIGMTTGYTDPFASVTGRDSFEIRTRAPELITEPLTPKQQQALGAYDSKGLRISYDADMRFVGDRLAESLQKAESVQDAIHVVLGEQNTTGDPLVFQGCTRLMTALTQGTIDAHDRTQVASCFEGEDPYSEALRQARAVIQSNPQRAAQILAGAIAEAEASGRYNDTGEAVHRMFDSYGSRIYYNLHQADPGRSVALAPPSLLMCYLDAINLLDESFTQSEDAVAYGKRCIEMAPTFAQAYRRSARAYMLVGDLDNAAQLLIRCLNFATSPEEIAMAYYQLAYVEWKAGRSAAGLACYCKSIMTSSIYAAQSTIELRELMREEGMDVMSGKDIDKTLESAGIPLAPTKAVLDEIHFAIQAAVDANLFTVARSLLTTYMMHRPDDAFANVLRSLDDPRVENLLGA